MAHGTQSAERVSQLAQQVNALALLVAEEAAALAQAPEVSAGASVCDRLIDVLGHLQQDSLALRAARTTSPDDRAAAFGRLMRRLETGVDGPGETFDRDSLYER